MFDPSWEEGCKSCSFLADTFDGGSLHLPARDVSFVAISRAPISKIEEFKKRMGWSFHDELATASRQVPGLRLELRSRGF